MAFKVLSLGLYGTEEAKRPDLRTLEGLDGLENEEVTITTDCYYIKS